MRHAPLITVAPLPGRREQTPGVASMNIHVESYSGHKLNERPIKFSIGDRTFFVESIADQWQGIDGAYFRVQADDGNTYILRYNEVTDAWTLETSLDCRQNPTNKT